MGQVMIFKRLSYIMEHVSATPDLALPPRIRR